MIDDAQLDKWEESMKVHESMRILVSPTKVLELIAEVRRLRSLLPWCYANLTVDALGSPRLHDLLAELEGMEK